MVIRQMQEHKSPEDEDTFRQEIPPLVLTKRQCGTSLLDIGFWRTRDLSGSKCEYILIYFRKDLK